MGNLFFEASRNIYGQLTEIFDFVWPTAAGMWNLRWQVIGYIAVQPNTTIEVLEGRFVTGSKIHGANLKRACIEHDWEQQQEQFAKFLVTNLCALYEAWIEQVMESLNINDNDIRKRLQFPTEVSDAGVRKGVWSAVDKITSDRSTFLGDSFYSTLITHPKNSRDKLDNLLKCYRFFKESRNCFIHDAGIADKELEKAYNAFLTVATPEQLGVKEVPVHYPIVVGQPIKLSLRGVVGLGDIILKMIATLDAELSKSEGAELEFEKRWNDKHPHKPTLKANTPQNLAAREKTIKRLVKGLGFPIPSQTTELETFLVNKRLLR